MPNWTTNYLACHEDDLRRIVNDQLLAMRR